MLRVRCPGRLGSCSPVRPSGLLSCWCGTLGHSAPLHRCARVVCCVACAVCWATWLLSTGAPAKCVPLLVQWHGSLGSCSPLCLLGVLRCVCGVLGHLAPVHRCARSVSRVALCCVCGVLGHLALVHRCACSVLCFACAVSLPTWLLFTAVRARCVVLRVRCPGLPGSSSPVCPLGALLCLCGVLRPLAPVHRCACLVCCVACAVSWATWLLSTGVPARCVVLHVRCPGSLGSCSPVPPLGVLCYVCGLLGHFAPDHQGARAVCFVACAVSCGTSLLFTGVPARCVVLRVQWPGPLGFCSPVCSLGVLCCVCDVLGPWALFTGVLACWAVLRVWCAGPLGSCSTVCLLGVLCRVCGVLCHFAPLHRCARLVFRVACAMSWATWRGVAAGRSLVHPDGGCFVAVRGWVPSERALVHPDSGCSVAGRGLIRCRPRTRLSGWQLVLLGTCSRAVVCCVLCALSGFAAPGSRCCLAPVRVPWLWPAACLSGVRPGPAWCAAPHPVRLLSVLSVQPTLPTAHPPRQRHRNRPPPTPEHKPLTTHTQTHANHQQHQQRQRRRKP